MLETSGTHLGQPLVRSKSRLPAKLSTERKYFAWKETLSHLHTTCHLIGSIILAMEKVHQAVIRVNQKTLNFAPRAYPLCCWERQDRVPMLLGRYECCVGSGARRERLPSVSARQSYDADESLKRHIALVQTHLCYRVP